MEETTHYGLFPLWASPLWFKAVGHLLMIPVSPCQLPRGRAQENWIVSPPPSSPKLVSLWGQLWNPNLRAYQQVFLSQTASRDWLLFPPWLFLSSGEKPCPVLTPCPTLYLLVKTNLANRADWGRCQKNSWTKAKQVKENTFLLYSTIASLKQSQRMGGREPLASSMSLRWEGQIAPMVAPELLQDNSKLSGLSIIPQLALYKLGKHTPVFPLVAEGWYSAWHGL